MTDTSHINAINLQVWAEDLAMADKANGTYRDNLALDRKYYLWQSDHQTYPLGMDGEPEAFAAQLRAALPNVNTLRMPFNEFSFDQHGQLHAQYARFLKAAAGQGFEIIMVYASGAAQGHNVDLNTPDDAMRFLEGEVLDGMTAGWSQMLDWMEAHPDAAGAVYGYEIANEPAMYQNGDRMVSDERFVELYAEHMIAIGQMIAGRTAENILVGGFGFSGRFDDLNAGNIGGLTAIEAIRAEFGERLVWSAHLYPGWVDSGGDPESLAEALDAHFAAIAGDAMLVTEINGNGAFLDNPEQLSSDPAIYARAYEWFADNGVGVGWFPGAETGGSNFVVIDANGSLRFLHQGSLAHGMNLFSLGEAPAEHAGDERIVTDLVVGRVRNERHDVDGRTFDDIDGIAYGFGFGGDDWITGQDLANDLIYGGTGNDVATGGDGDDHLFGQDGDDVLSGGAGNDVLVGGRGNDTLDAGTGWDMLTGGGGADLFRLSGLGEAHIADFSWSEGDRLEIDGILRELKWMVREGVAKTVGADGLENDLVIAGTSGNIVLHDFWDGHSDALVNAGPGPVAGPVDGTDGDDVIDAAYRDADNNGITASGDTVRARRGDDVVHAAAGDDMVYGDAGNDTLHGAAGNDVLRGGVQEDRLYGEDGDDTLYGDAGFDWLEGGAGNDELYGGSQADNLLGGSGDDVLLGGGGFDRLFGGGDNDTLFGGNGPDAMFGQTGDDTLRGQDGKDRLFGGVGNDVLDGGNGDDFLSGGAGFDILLGSTGNDTMAGNFNADLFLFTDFGGGFGADTIIDFEATNDLERIDLSGVGSIVSFADLLADHMTQQQSDVVIDAGGGNTITLLGVALGDLDANDFVF